MELLIQTQNLNFDAFKSRLLGLIPIILLSKFKCIFQLVFIAKNPNMDMDCNTTLLHGLVMKLSFS